MHAALFSRLISIVLEPKPIRLQLAQKPEICRVIGKLTADYLDSIAQLGKHVEHGCDLENQVFILDLKDQQRNRFPGIDKEINGAQILDLFGPGEDRRAARSSRHLRLLIMRVAAYLEYGSEELSVQSRLPFCRLKQFSWILLA